MSRLSLSCCRRLLSLCSIELHQEELPLEWSGIVTLDASVHQPVRFPIQVDDALDGADFYLVRGDIDVAGFDVIDELPAVFPPSSPSANSKPFSATATRLERLPDVAIG